MQTAYYEHRTYMYIYKIVRTNNNLHFAYACKVEVQCIYWISDDHYLFHFIFWCEWSETTNIRLRKLKLKSNTYQKPNPKRQPFASEIRIRVIFCKIHHSTDTEWTPIIFIHVCYNNKLGRSIAHTCYSWKFSHTLTVKHNVDRIDMRQF